MMQPKVISIGVYMVSFSRLSWWCSVHSLLVRHKQRHWLWTPLSWCFRMWYSTISWFSVSSVSRNWELPVPLSVLHWRKWYRWFSLSFIPGSGLTAKNMHWIYYPNSKERHWSGFSMFRCGRWFRILFLCLPGSCSSCS